MEFLWSVAADLLRSHGLRSVRISTPADHPACDGGGVTSGSPGASEASAAFGSINYDAGAAADGSLPSLVVDFGVLAEDILRTSRVPFQPGAVSTPELSGLDLQVTADDGSFVISSRGERITGLRVLAPDGALLVDGDRLGTFVTGGRSSKTWKPDAPPPPGSVLEVTEYLGYRHI